MENEEALRKFTNSHLSGDWSTFDELATDDFVLIGPSPEPLDKVAFLMWLKSAYEANDNIDNNLTVVESTGDTLRCTVQMEGTHTRD